MIPKHRRKEEERLHNRIHASLIDMRVFDFMDTIESYIGFDFALRRNAIVQYVPSAKGDSIRVLFSSKDGPPVQNAVNTLRYFQGEIMPILAAHPRSMIAMDWSPQEQFMRTNGMHTAIKTFVAGYLYRGILDHKSYPIFMSPKTIRNHFGIAVKEPKEAVWGKFRDRTNGMVIPRMNEHELDALILAWCLKDALPALIGDLLPYSNTKGIYAPLATVQGFL